MRASAIVVTGATGFLGRELLRHAPNTIDERVEIRDRRAVEELFARARPSAVIHTAYRQDGADAWSVNVDGAEIVAAAAAAVGARLVHVSTDVVFDGRKGTPYVESDPPNPLTPYGRSKAAAERRVMAAHPAALVVRTSLIYGGPGHERSKHEDLALDPAATFYDDELRCPVQVGDLAAALLELVEHDGRGPLHVAGAHAVSRADFAELTAGHAVRRRKAPPDRPLDCRLDASAARLVLRTELRGVRDVVGR